MLRADMLDPAEVCWLNGFARKDWKYFFNLASGAQGWQREDAEQEAGEGFPAPRLARSTCSAANSYRYTL